MHDPRCLWMESIHETINNSLKFVTTFIPRTSARIAAGNDAETKWNRSNQASHQMK